MNTNNSMNMNNNHNMEVDIDIAEWMDDMDATWELLQRESFSAEACFFNCTNELYKKNVLEHLDQVEMAMKVYTKCMLEQLQKHNFMEKSLPVPPLEPGAFCNDTCTSDAAWTSHPGSDITHKDIIEQIERFRCSLNVADLIGLRHKIDVMNECVRTYVERNRTFVAKYVIDENDPNYSSLPDWMFFPFQK